MKKENRGGSRKNAGRKYKYGEPTKTISFACPKSKVKEIKQLIKTALTGHLKQDEMNREIKFRAWNTALKEMMFNVGVHPHLAMDLAADDEYYLTNSDGRYLIGLGFSNYPVMQYTGLKDKNGVDIYEGDIVSFRANYTSKPCGHLKGIVKITPFKLILVVGEHEYDAYDETDEFPYTHCEITGNIYQKPELCTPS